MTVIETPVNTIDDIFQGLASFPRFVPFKMVYNATREKFDKIPHNGSHGLSTKEPANWTDLITAIDVAANTYGLSGVGFVMTGGVEFNGWTLVGFDFDDITDEWKPPFKSYAELSPSKKGARMFAWAPTEWAKQYQDTLNCTPPHCAHAEIYIGTAPRFLTVTFDAIQLEEIAQLSPKDLFKIETWGIHDFEAPKPDLPYIDVAGVVLDLDKFKLTKEQKHLIAGTVPENGKLDRSRTWMGLGIKLLDGGAAQQDILATMVHKPALMRYLLDHRNNDPDRAIEFARSEINRAYKDSMAGKRKQLISFNEKWGDKPVTTPEVDAPVKPKPSDLKFPMEVFDKAPGLVGEIAHWILGAVYKPREEFAYAVALSMMACLIGPYRRHSSRNGKLNMYLTLVGGTGTGKTDAISAGALLLSFTEAKDCILDFPASEAALRRQLTLTPNILLKVDEIAHKLDGMKDNTNGSSMGRAILEAYDGERMPPKVYADSKNSLPSVENPFVQILGGTTDKVWDVVKTSHLDDGTLNRFVFVCAPEKPAYLVNEDPQCEVPKALNDKLNTFWRAGRMSDLIGDVPGTKFGRHISYDDDVKQALVKLGKQVHDKQQEEYGNLYSRLELNTKKIASILVIGDGREVVEMRDYKQALAFMEWSLANTHYKISGILANNEYEKQTKKFIRQLEKAGGKMTRRLLFKNAGLYLQDAEKVLNSMEAYGIASVYEEENNSNNHTKTTWVELV